MPAIWNNHEILIRQFFFQKNTVNKEKLYENEFESAEIFP